MAAALLVCAPLLLHSALPLGSDVYATVHYIQGFKKAFSEGDWYPRWTDRSNRDLGGPSFVMFPPLFYYLAGAGWGLTGGLVGGVKLAVLVISLLTALSFYLLARDWIGPGLPAAAASALYLLLPYRVLDIYQRFAMSETAAFIFIPLILLFAKRTLDGGGGFQFAGLALSYAGLQYSHIVTSLAFSIFLGPWLLWESRARLGALIRPVAGLACGVGLAAPALLPAVIEKSYANIQWVREMPNGDFRNNFIFRDDPIPGLGFKDPVKPPVLKSAHSQLLMAGAAAALALAGLGADRRRRRLVLAAAAGCAAAYLLQLEISTPLWRVVPELATIQFPWRFQTLMVLTAALLAGFALDALRGAAGGGARSGRSGPVAGLWLLGALAAVNLFLAWQNAHLKPFVFDEEAGQRPGVVDWAEPAFTPVAYTGYKEFRTVRVDLPRAAFSEGQGEVTVASWLSSKRELNVRSAAGGTVLIRSFWFPGWTARLDGAPLEIRPAPPYGAISFNAPPGSHTVAMSFEPTPARRAASFAGAASVAVTALLAWGFLRRPVRTLEAA